MNDGKASAGLVFGFAFAILHRVTTIAGDRQQGVEQIAQVCGWG